MSSRTRPSMNKRNREQQRRERREVKHARRKDRATQRQDRSPLDAGEDPDLAGIVAGPQPISDDAPEHAGDDEQAE